MGFFTPKADNETAVEKQRNDEYAETISDLRQAVSIAEGKVAKMTIARTPDGMMKMAEAAANEIEETFAVGGMSRAQRFLNITKTIRRQIAIACGGEALWMD
jgi:hypothetical protein